MPVITDKKPIGEQESEVESKSYSPPFNLYAAKRLASTPLKLSSPTQHGTDLGVLGVDLPASGSVSDISAWSKARSAAKMGEVVPDDPVSGLSALSSLMEKPEDVAKRVKRQDQIKGVLALGDAIRHIGNIANTVNGAPVQQFNSPLAEYDNQIAKDDALRLSAHKQAMAYQQMKDTLDYKNKVMLANQQNRDFANKLGQMQYEFNVWKAKQDMEGRANDRAFKADQFEWKKSQDKIKNSQTDRRIAKIGTGRGGSVKHGVPIFNPNTGKWENAFTQWEYQARAGQYGYDTDTKSRTDSNLDGTERKTNRQSTSGNIGRQSAAKARQNDISKVLDKNKKKRQSNNGGGQKGHDGRGFK